MGTIHASVSIQNFERAIVMNVIRIWAIGSNSFREIIRERILYVVGLFALVMVAAWRILPEVSGSAQSKILLDSGPAAMTILSVVIAIFVGTNLINREVDRRTILALIPKPISRAEFILGKHLGLSAVLALLLATMLPIYFAMLSLAKISYPVGPLLTSTLFLLLELMVIVAAALMFGSMTSSLLATLLTVMTYLAGHATQEMVKLTNNGIANNPAMQNISNVLFTILPNLSALDLKNTAVYGMLPPINTLWTSAAYAFVYTGILLGITIAVFSRRQF
jgi:ABC-type transport system involved in multi-copper enzyme maturation permease subunit